MASKQSRSCRTRRIAGSAWGSSLSGIVGCASCGNIGLPGPCCVEFLVISLIVGRRRMHGSAKADPFPSCGMIRHVAQKKRAGAHMRLASGNHAGAVEAPRRRGARAVLHSFSCLWFFWGD